MSKVITANTLATGTVVFYGAAGVWVGAIAEAAVFDDDASAEAALFEAKEDEAKAIVVDAFVVDQSPDGEGKTKMTLRDTIRAYGPTIKFLPPDEPALSPAASVG